MAKYTLVWFDDGEYHTKTIIAKTDKEAIEFSKTYDIGLGICFDVFKDKNSYSTMICGIWKPKENKFTRLHP
jgi:hypothetical protein